MENCERPLTEQTFFFFFFLRFTENTVPRHNRLTRSVWFGFNMPGAFIYRRCRIGNVFVWMCAGEVGRDRGRETADRRHGQGERGAQ